MLLSKLISEVKVIHSNVDTSRDVSGITEKSGYVKDGYVFVCLKGTRADGNDYIGEALENGAYCVITENEQPENVPHVRVENARAALSLMWAAWYGYPARSMKIIGITGTNGKTTTAYMLKSILDAAGKKTGLIGTVKYVIGENQYDSDMTTPDPELMQRLLSEMKESGHEYVICEVSSHALALDKLYGMTLDIAIFTNLSQDHLDFHKDMENYFAAKKKLFSMCKHAVINIDNAYGRRLADEKICAETTTCSAHFNDADICAKNIRMLESSVEYEFLATNTIYRIACPVPGMFSMYNSLLAATAADYMGIDPVFITGGIKNMEAVAGRMERVETGRDFSVLIDFAHTPGALESVLKSVRTFAKGRIVCLFGCGGDRDRSKRPAMGRVAAENSDYVIITSDNPRSEDPMKIINDILTGVVSVDKIKNNYVVIESREEAIRYAIRNAKKDDTVLLAGKGHETYVEDRAGKHGFDERAVIKDELSK